VDVGLGAELKALILLPPCSWKCAAMA
jgi:hypothetical protein